MSVVPDEARVSERLEDPGVLFSCRSEAWSWNTSGEIVFADDDRLDRWLDDMVVIVERDFGARTKITTDEWDHAGLEMRLDDGTYAYADITRDGRRIGLGVFSPCVTDLADYYETDNPAGGY